jgi:hypothetical protein
LLQLAPASAEAGVGREIDHVLRHSVRHHRHGKVRPDDAGHQIDLVALDHLFGDLHGEFRLLRIVLDDQLDIRVAGLLECQNEGIARVDAKPGAAARKRGDDADLHRISQCCAGRRH